MKKILLTGATGFLGSYILKNLLLKEDFEIYALVRGRTKSEAENRLFKILKPLCGGALLKKNVRICHGDLESLDFGLINRDIQSIDTILHCAAVTGFNLPLEYARKINCGGTENVLNFAMSCSKLKNFFYISTMFIMGDYEGAFCESTLLNVDRKFFNNYERTKFEAEQLIDNYRAKGLPVSIFRPSIITGSYESGTTTNFKMFYEPLRFFSKQLFREVPADITCKQNLVPVDIASNAITILMENEKAGNSNIYHIVSPELDTFGNFMATASEFFRYQNPNFIRQQNFCFDVLTSVQKKILEPFLPYMNYKGIQVSVATTKLLKDLGFVYPRINRDFYFRLFEYLNKVGFIKIKKSNDL